MRVQELLDEDRTAWDEYVRNSPKALPYHLVGWKDVMGSTYGYPSRYLMAKEGGRIEGVMPLYEINSRILGNSLTTLPGGICAERRKAAEALIERAKEITGQIGADYLTIRDSRDKWNCDLTLIDKHRAMVRKLPSEAETLWRDLDKRLRRHIRIAIDSDLDARVGSREYLDDFYTVLSAFLRERGTPVFGRAFLRHVFEAFGDRHLIVCVWCEEELVGAYSAFLFRDTIYGAWGGSLRKSFDRRPNHMLYWRYMEYGCEHGFRHIDLGRSVVGSGQYRFKKGWGAEPRGVYQLYHFRGRHRMADLSTRVESDLKYRLFGWLWRKLPLHVTQYMGARIRRHVPFG
jgi:FemAB-related protein (PEP-CTERM system-associated)